MPENYQADIRSHISNEQGSFALMNPSRHLAVMQARELIGVSRKLGVDREFRFTDLRDIVVRRKTIVLGTLLTCLLVGALCCALGTRRYMAAAEIQVGRESENKLGLQTDGSQDPPSDALAENVTLQTQARILQSDTLALKVINDLSLESTSDFSTKFGVFGYLTGGFSADALPDSNHVTLEESPRRRAHTLEVFRNNLDVKPVAGTRLIEISYLNPNPELAAQIVNHLSASLVDYNFQIRHEATSRTTEWLSGQMSDLRKQSQDLQAKVAELQRESGVFSTGQTDASGREQVYSDVLDKLQQSTTALSQAQANRIAKAAIYRMAQTGDPEAISQLSGSSIFASSSGFDSSLSLIQSMRMEEATVSGQIGEMAEKFGSAYPKLSELRSRLNVLQDSIRAEVSRVAQRSKNDYEVAQRVEDNARKIYIDQKSQADLANDKTIEYMIARQEAEGSRNLYESLFRQLKQSGVLEGFRADNISLVDPARVPAKPARPRMLLYMAMALVAGVLLGSCAAVVRDGVDPRIHDLAALESELGHVPLGILPFHKRARSRLGTTSWHRTSDARAKDFPLRGTVLQIGIEEKKHKDGRRLSNEKVEIPALNEPHSPFIEALRALRTSLLLSKATVPPQVILITSSIPGEGKSMLSANFAVLLAGRHKKVLLVDTDFRRPSLDRAFKISSQTGLGWLLALESVEGDDQAFQAAARSVIVPVLEVPQLRIVPSGSIPEYPTELLSSDRMHQAIKLWRTHYDYIVIDGPPVLTVTDSVILSSMADFTLLTARYQVVEQQALLRAYSILRMQQGQNNIGIVLNAIHKAAGSYYPSYAYDSSSYESSKRVS